LRVNQAALSLLGSWNSFYVIVGTAAAALTGLQFVVIVVAAQSEMGSEDTTRAFGTPTIVHFSGVLLFSAILSAPWHSVAYFTAALGAFALVGFAYTLAVLRHARKVTDYAPVLEDWICHTVLPLVAYGALAGAAVALSAHPAPSLFVVGAGALLLLFIGIHNAWDSVTYIAVHRRKKADRSG
jgi:hypothetical protein